MKRAATAAVTPIVRFVEWLFGPRAPGIDLALALFASGWAWLMLVKPELFDRSPFVGMNWLPDASWICLFWGMAGLHGLGFIRPTAITIRQGACLLSAWIWITVSASIATIEITTGVVTYGIIGAGALAGALYISGQPKAA